MNRRARLVELALATGLAVVAAAVSPPGICLLSGRQDLSLRVNTVSVVLALTLFVVALALAARGRARRLGFVVLLWLIPMALLAGLETAALALGLANRISRLEDTSLLRHYAEWPSAMLDVARWNPAAVAPRLYRPWAGHGILINELGLRTSPPQPKRPGEWRVAVTGGSTVWGWRVLDADTIPARLQAALRQAGRADVTVYNFGIEGATLRQELTLLKRFGATYAIDQVIFYTGGNDAFLLYNAHAASTGRAKAVAGAVADFELIKTFVRLQRAWSTPSSVETDRVRTALQAELQTNPLREDIATAADYCRAAAIRCDVALQPVLFARRHPPGPEAVLAKAWTHVYPELDWFASELYRGAAQSSGATQIHDLSRMFDQMDNPVFVDSLHLSETGNRVVAEQLVAIVAGRAN